MFSIDNPYRFPDKKSVFDFVWKFVCKPVSDSIRMSAGVFVECSVLSVHDSVSTVEYSIREKLKSYDFRRKNL
jgi:hypothetical protein